MTSSSSLDLATITTAAAAAAPILRRAPRQERARWLRAMADAIEAETTELVALAHEETHIAAARLVGEVGRTTGQLRMFARVVDDGGFLEASIDAADPAATPPRPDIRRILVPVGPVAVYSASNFPFAFSVAGGDTASALAAGCPVIVKGHSGHPRLSARTAEIVSAALRAAGAPEGTFALVTGRQTGIDLVTHPAVKAASFTGSVRGGRALFDLAAGRPDPIPFYGELGSVNPVFVTPGADATRAEELAAGLAESFQMSLGQLCTKPGIVFVPSGGRFAAAIAGLVPEPASGALLTDPIADDFRRSVGTLEAMAGVSRIAGSAAQPDSGAAAVVFSTTLDLLETSPELLEERFGPTTLLVEYTELDRAVAVAEQLGGSLTATLHAEPDEFDAAVVDRLTALAGRVLFAGWPTGVAVTWGQMHGGPWPSTTSLHTSVGGTAARRFQRPVAYQSAPAGILPAELRDEAGDIPRRINGAAVGTGSAV
ncbi:MAG: aldehyde dehydrogenase [Glaciihabitans sp.]|nr:aldehyde dehydrogenase [Glaciihabitans sp.]